MGLFKPSLQNKDLSKALEAVKKLTDQAVLAYVAKDDSDGYMCV